MFFCFTTIAQFLSNLFWFFWRSSFIQYLDGAWRTTYFGTRAKDWNSRCLDGSWWAEEVMHDKLFSRLRDFLWATWWIVWIVTSQTSHLNSHQHFRSLVLYHVHSTWLLANKAVFSSPQGCSALKPWLNGWSRTSTPWLPRFLIVKFITYDKHFPVHFQRVASDKVWTGEHRQPLETPSFILRNLEEDGESSICLVPWSIPTSTYTQVGWRVFIQPDDIQTAPRPSPHRRSCRSHNVIKRHYSLGESKIDFYARPFCQSSACVSSHGYWPEFWNPLSADLTRGTLQIIQHALDVVTSRDWCSLTWLAVSNIAQLHQYPLYASPTVP